ncbi:MAG: 4Fe-4S dicluster domain-containing protein, partial [Coriobacteriales bacterium]|nr:4Fe-4S dicluster domain-containing protein [Coriobacteriales bacterium]
MSRPPVMRSTAPGADIRLNASTDGSVYLVAAQTEKGAAALEAWRPFLEDGGAEAARSACPTCHCFDISQENRMQEGERFRCWDSCMFSSYTEMAGHH